MIIVAIGIGGVLGLYLLADYDVMKMVGFGVSCVVLGCLFHMLDKKLSG